MQYKLFHGKKISCLGMGNMRLPEIGEPGKMHIDYEKAQALIDRAYAGGVNYFDTAYIYHGGESEVFTGRALKKYPRDSYYVADKFNFQANPDYRAQWQEQLQRLEMDRVDFYMLHGIQDNDVDDVLKSGCIAYFDSLKKSGQISFLGFSFHGSEGSMKKMLKAYDWDFCQIQLNYYDWEYGEQKVLYRMLEEADIPVTVMEPVHGGLLARMNEPSAKLLKQADPDASLASWAMRWVKSLPRVQVVLSGMGTLEMLEDNLATFSSERPFTAEDTLLVQKAAQLLRPEISMPCTGCRYCISSCPMNLDIPTLLRYYNDRKIDSNWRLTNLMGMEPESRPTACIGCGACTVHCPQSLAIPDAMREMAEVLNGFPKV